MLNNLIRHKMNKNKSSARIAGLIFLFLIVADLFAEIFVRQNIYVSNNPLATTSNIMKAGSFLVWGL